MSITIWAWEDRGRHIGVSEAGPASVLDLSSLDTDGVDEGALWTAIEGQSSKERCDWFRDLLKVHSARQDIGGCRLYFPVRVSEVWASGVTYERSRNARAEETEGAEGFYRKVYDAPRPELFFKTTGERLAGPGETMGLRADSRWTVPEPELAVVLDPAGRPFGFTCANDLSSRDIEGANPLYLPQAKMFHKSAALGPSVALAGSLDPSRLEIRLEIRRDERTIFKGTVNTAKMHRGLHDLVHYLGRAYELSPWTVLMTGTGIVPPDDVALEEGDECTISIEGIGRLVNPVRRIGASWAKVLG